MTGAPDRRQVLVVDDDPAVRAVLADLLDEAGYDVVATAADGVEGVDRARELRPEVVLLDVRMPRLDGIEAARRIRAADEAVRIVVLSAYEDATLRADARAAGAAAYLVKGGPFEELVRALDG